MYRTSKEKVIAYRPGRAPVIGFVSYIDDKKPVILRRHGWEVGDDVHDDFYDMISHDNGKTWSEPTLSLKNFEADGGKYIHTENAAILVPQRDRLLTFTNELFHKLPLDHAQMGAPARVRITCSKPQDFMAAKPFVTDFGIKGGVLISFCHPFLDKQGRVLVPVMGCAWDGVDGDLKGLGIELDAQGKGPSYGLSWVMIGEFDGNNDIHWKLSGKVPFDISKTSRGLCEPTINQLASGKLVMVCRGSNHIWPDMPGRKWVTFSDDAGLTWTHAQPLAYDTGYVPESSSTGSALIRHSKTGKLYWLGNLCRAGQRANGNMPRAPLYIAEVQEEPFALKRETITEIDDAQPDEIADVQHSNFKVYEDRQTGEFVVYLTRYSENGFENLDWMKANHYRYRVTV
jgi:hypothetical protein